MSGQRSILLRGSLALLLCVVLLSTCLTPSVWGTKSESPPTDGPETTHDVLIGEFPGLGDGGNGTGGPSNEGDPDDYDRILIEIWISLLQNPLFPFL